MLPRLLTNLVLIVIACLLGVRAFESLHFLRPAMTPADLGEPLGAATMWKLASVRDDPKWCRAVLGFDKVAFAPVADKVTAPGCGWQGAVRLTGPGLSPRGATMTCPLAVALTVWEHDVVRPAVRAELKTSLTGLDHYGTYNCRPIAGTDRSSQHATANAVDIAAFRLARGPAITVARDWRGDGPRAAFLRRVHDGACRVFGTTLGPDYNAAHHDHLHLDMAQWSYCR